MRRWTASRRARRRSCCGSSQEALANVRKHADATLVRVELTETGGGLGLRVTDNGRGFATDRVDRAGYGLSSMESGPKSSAARLTIDSREQDGTRVLVHAAAGARGDEGPMSEQVTRVMLVDDHALVRSAVRQALSVRRPGDRGGGGDRG